MLSNEVNIEKKSEKFPGTKYLYLKINNRTDTECIRLCKIKHVSEKEAPA